MTLYKAYNGPMVTTAAFVPVTTGTAIKTMLQFLAGTADPMKVIAWGIEFDGIAAAAPIKCELVHTGTVAATVTAHVAAGIQPFQADQLASAVQLSTTGTGYTATAEGTITTTRYGDIHLVDPTQKLSYEWSLGREFWVPAAGILRVRVTAAAAVNCVTWVLWED
jgi:hypothetical protein